MKIGILALQGAFVEHARILQELGVESVEIRNRDDFETVRNELTGLILPGGESTAMGKLLRDLDLLLPLQEQIKQGLPVFGTCAGLILLAKDLGEEQERHLATMDISVTRNAYGCQLGSFDTVEEFAGVGRIPMTFIRGPIITQVGKDVEVLARVAGEIVAARQGHMLVTSFHPELTEDKSLHAYFCQLAANFHI